MRLQQISLGRCTGGLGVSYELTVQIKTAGPGRAEPSRGRCPTNDHAVGFLMEIGIGSERI